MLLCVLLVQEWCGVNESVSSSEEATAQAGTVADVSMMFENVREGSGCRQQDVPDDVSAAARWSVPA